MRVKITAPKSGTRKVRVTPPQGGNSSVDQLRMNEMPIAKYGMAIDNSKANQNSFDSRWSPSSYQGQIGVNPDPNPYARTGNTLPEVSVDKANVNAELDEQVMGNFTPDGMPSLMAVGGPSHAQGGKDINVPDGSFIFSTTPSLKITNPYGEQSPQPDGVVTAKKGGTIHAKEKQSGTGLPYGYKDFGASKPTTPAKLAKQYKLQKYTKTLADPKADPVSKKTAELMVANYGGKLNQLAELQEAKKHKMGLRDNQQQQPQMPVAQLGGGQGFRFDQEPTVDNQQFSIPGQMTSEYTITAKRPDVREKYIHPLNQLPAEYPDLPVMPTSIPDPTNMSNYSNPNTRLGSYTADHTNVPFTAPTPDKWGLVNSIYNAPTIHRYPGWEPANGAVTPNTVFEDPTRAIAATQENANAVGYNNALSANSRAARASTLGAEGVEGAAAANIAASVNNRNVDTSNKASVEVSGIANRLHEQNAQRLSKMYQENVISAQQYDNALRENRNDVTKQAQTMWNDRSKMDFLNKTSPFFYADPITGARGFKSLETKANFEREVQHLGQTMGVSDANKDRVKDRASYYVTSLHMNPNAAAKQAIRDYTEHEKETTDPLNPWNKPKQTISRQKYDDAEDAPNKFGGKIPKRKFGGFSNHQLKKFVAGSYSK